MEKQKILYIKGLKRLGMWEKWMFYMKSVTGEGRCLSSWQSSPRTEEKLKEIHLHQDPRSSNLVILEALGKKKYGVKTGDISPASKKRGVQGGKDSDWRESLTFKQALYPYRVGEDMHNPSKMHMNFPSSNSSRLNSSQWINYEYCMCWNAGDQIEFTVKKKKKKTQQKQICDIKLLWG